LSQRDFKAFVVKSWKRRKTKITQYFFIVKKWLKITPFSNFQKQFCLLTQNRLTEILFCDNLIAEIMTHHYCSDGAGGRQRCRE